jgi:hypothetical protein
LSQYEKHIYAKHIYEKRISFLVPFGFPNPFKPFAHLLDTAVAVLRIAAVAISLHPLSNKSILYGVALDLAPPPPT